MTLRAADGSLGKPNGDVGGSFAGLRTPIDGTLSYNIDLGVGAMNLAPFSFSVRGATSATSISVQAIGDGAGGVPVACYSVI